jgi:alkylhydroperoxidase family enzyme
MSAWSTAGDPRAAHAPEVLVALQATCASVRAASDPALLELARRRLAELLGDDAEADARPWGSPAAEAVERVASWPDAGCFDERDRAALALTEQFAVDVTSVAAGPLGAAAGALGDGLVPFVQGLYLLDLGQRAGMALGALFGQALPSTGWAWPDDGTEVPADPMVAVDGLLRATGRLRSLDPVLRELVRLRGARHHQCRRCQSVRSLAALDAGADEALLGEADVLARPDLPAPTRAALRFTDAVLVGRPQLPEALVDEVHQQLAPVEAVELVCYLVRNAANKIAVAFAADAPIVEEGFELQVIDADGDTVTVDAAGA